MKNKKSILAFFRDLHAKQEIQLNAVGNECGESFHVPEFHLLESIPVEAFLPTSKQIIRRAEGDAILGYNCGLYCIQQQNLLLDAFNELVDAAATIGQYPRIQTTKRLDYKDLNERQFVCMDMEEIVRRNIVRRHNENFLVVMDVDAATLEHELYEAVFQNAVYINENSFERTSDLDDVDFYPAFNEVGQTSDEEEDENCLEEVKGVVQAMWKDNRERVMHLMDECMRVVFRLSRLGLGENNRNTSLSLYSRLSEEDDPSALAILGRVRAGQLYYLYEYLEDTYGNYYIKKYLDDIFEEKFGAEFTQLFQNKADKGKLIEEARMVIDLVRRCLIRECIQYNRRSFRRDEMRWRDTTNIQEISFSRYYNNPESIDYKYYEYVEEGGSKSIIEYLEHLPENHGPLVTIYNMYDVMQKLKKIVKQQKGGAQ